MRVLALVTDAFGGHGGIAQYNRHLLAALCDHANCAGIVAVPRLVAGPMEPLPVGLSWITAGLGGIWRYVWTVLKLLVTGGKFDLIICGHINLLPLAVLARRMTGARLVLQLHGIEAWRPTGRKLINRLVGQVDLGLAVSRFTRRRFLAWSGLEPSKCLVLPNTIADQVFGPGPRDAVLLNRYKLQGREVIMSCGRLASEERYKGFDEVMEALPVLREVHSNLAYLIVGSGNDRARLEEKSRKLGVSEHVIFTGNIAESEKAAHYRLADAYVMPSSGEGFGIVFLEALATGLPVIAGADDGGRDALRDGLYGTLVGQGDRAALIRAVRTALENRPEGRAPEVFAVANFRQRLGAIIDAAVADGI